MTFSDAIQSLTDGRAAKPSTWGGYVARVDRPSEFSASAAYAVGDLVSHDGKAYRCSSAHSAGDAWSPSHFAELFTLPAAFSAESTYSVGALVTYNSLPYQCVSAVSSAGAWDASKWRRLADVPHVLVFRERSDEDGDGDSASVYVAACTVSASGRSYGAFAPEFSVDPQLLYAVVWDSTWTVGDMAAFEAARSGSTRW